MSEKNWANDLDQVRQFEERALSAGMNRRTFLKILAAAGASSAILAACGGPTTAPTMAPVAPTAAGPAATTAPAVATATSAPKPTTAATTAAVQPPAGGKVPDAEQVFRDGSYMPAEPASMDFNGNLYCAGLTEIWAGLLNFNFDYKPQPYLATFTQKDNVFTFTMKDGVKWTNGDPVTAKDFEWSWIRMLHPGTKAPYSSLLYDVKGAEAFNNRKDLKGTQAEIEAANKEVGIVATDAKTLVVTLNGPYGYFPTIVAYIAALPNHRATLEKTGEVFGDAVKASEPAVITTNGPFKLTKWTHEKVIEMERWDGWTAGPKPTIRKVIYPVIADTQELASYEKNEVDRANVQPAEIKRVKADAKLSKELITYSGTGVFYLVPNPNMKPFDVKGVRRAINHAIDRAAIVKSVLQDVGKISYTFDGPDLPHYVDPAKYPKIVELCKFDPKLAMDELKGTPYEGGKNWPAIKLSYRTGEERIGSTQAVQAIQAMLKDNLNMSVELDPAEQKVFRPNMWDHKQQFTWIRWYSDYPDSNNNLYQVWYSGSGASGHRHDFANPAFDKLVTDAKVGTLDERTAKYAQAELVGLEDGYATYVYYLYSSRTYKPWVGGVPKNSRGEIVQDVNIFFAMPETLFIQEAEGRPKLS
ncbi:MAG: twin-arginine translocation signal domain-containing protein [Chloroflexi bacterium]|nr:twin-arginine translocation signal domain-containing protein [Chloroflexota bacterium]